MRGFIKEENGFADLVFPIHQGLERNGDGLNVGANNPGLEHGNAKMVGVLLNLLRSMSVTCRRVFWPVLLLFLLKYGYPRGCLCRL